MKTSGIYEITNTVSQKRYIGSAVNIGRRWHRHKSEMRHKKHENRHLQSSWDKHGEEVFVFKILATCPKEYLIKLEQWFIDSLNPEFNICRRAGSALGLKLTDEAKLKISIANKGRIVSDDARKKISEAKKGKKRLTDISAETRKKIKLFHTTDMAAINRFKAVQKSNQKPVFQYTLSGDFVMGFESIKGAALYNNVSASAIRQAIRQRTCNGFQFKKNKSETIAPAIDHNKKIFVYRNGVLVGAYPSIKGAARSLGVNYSNLSSHLIGKRYKRVGGYTASYASENEYQNLTL